MPDHDDDLGFDPDTAITNEQVRETIKRLERENRDLKANIAEATQARRELSFVKAGIDLSTPTGKLFAKAYDGNPDLDEVRAAAIEYGLLEPPPATPTPSDEQAAFQRIDRAAATGRPASGPVDWSKRLKETRNPDEYWQVIKEYEQSLAE